MFRIVSDLGADIPREFKDDNLVVINQSVSLGGEDRIFHLDSDLDMRKFFDEVAKVESYATRAMTYQEIYSVIYPLAKESDLLCLSFSQRLSASGSQMQKVCADLDGKYGRMVYYDTQTATVGQGVLVYYATRLLKKGKSIDETVAILDQIKNNLRFYVLLDRENHFFKGGRCDGLEREKRGYPLLYLPLGDLYRKVAEFFAPQVGLAFLEKKLQQRDNALIFLGHGNNHSLALSLKEKWKNYAPKISTCYINPVMGVHTGKDPLLVAYLENSPLIEGL